MDEPLLKSPSRRQAPLLCCHLLGQDLPSKHPLLLLAALQHRLQVGSEKGAQGTRHQAVRQ